MTSLVDVICNSACSVESNAKSGKRNSIESLLFSYCILFVSKWLRGDGWRWRWHTRSTVYVVDKQKNASEAELRSLQSIADEWNRSKFIIIARFIYFPSSFVLVLVCKFNEKRIYSDFYLIRNMRAVALRGMASLKKHKARCDACGDGVFVVVRGSAKCSEKRNNVTENMSEINK